MTTYRRAENAPPVDRPCLHVTWARLAVLWWRDIAVSRVEPLELNELDDFVVSAVERLGHMHARAFEEFTGLPPMVFDGLARRLHSLGLIEWRDGALRPPDGPSRPRPAGPPGRTSTTTLDFLYLPDTDDLVVVEDGLADWERSGPKPVGAAPLPRLLHDVSLRTLLANRIERRQVANLPDDVVALAYGTDEPLTAMAGADRQLPVPVCPVFICEATVVLDQQRPDVKLEVTESTGRRRRQGELDGRVTIDISGATGLAQRWVDTVAFPADQPAEIEKAMRALGLTESPWPTPQSDPAGNWWLPVDGRHAQVLAVDGLLTVPIPLEVREPHVRVVAALQIQPIDEAARRLVKLDRMLQEVLQDQGPQGPPIGRHDQGVRDVGGITVLRQRAWQLRYYQLVHALREAEDFDYV